MYLTTLIAFALTFNVLLPKHAAFGNPLLSFLKILAMMIGEFDFNDTFVVDKIHEFGVDVSIFLTHIFFVLLLFLVTITIFNLILGLSVSNIQKLMEEAEEHRQGDRI